MNIRTVLIELFFFSLPFLMFGVYRLLVRDAEAQGKKAWPISILFIAGLSLAIVAWLFMIFKQDRIDDRCNSRAVLVDGQIVREEISGCDKNLEEVGAARSSDPGGSASDADGENETDPADP